MLKRHKIAMSLVVSMFICLCFFSTLHCEGKVASLTGPPIIFIETSNLIKLNFTMFAIEFYKATAGYNKIYYKNGSVLVYDDRVVLEYLSKAPDTWKQRGTPTGIGYIKVSDYYYNVTRFYTDYLGTSYNITYIVKSDSPMKISISLESGQTDTYRIAWYPSGITKLNWTKNDNRLTFGDESVDYGWIGFDWKDVYQSFGNITQTSCEAVAQGKKANIYFNIGVVNAGQTLIIDPSTVGTSVASFATSRVFQRKSFYAAALFWVFYSDGTNMVYSTSTNGSSWIVGGSSPIRACVYGVEFSICFDGTYVHYCYTSWSSGSDVYYRRGIPNSNGTITWSANEQVATPNAGYNFEPSISVDSSEYPWIGYKSTNLYPYVTKSSKNDGTWSPASGFPYQLSTTSAASWLVDIVSLTSGKVYVIYSHGSTYNYGKLWTGSWGSQETTMSHVEFNYAWSASAIGDDVHIVFTYNDYIIYNKRTYGVGWGTEEQVYDTGWYTRLPVLSAAGSNLYVFWSNDTSNHIYYKKCVSGTWDSSPTDWIDESVEVLTDDRYLTCFYNGGLHNGDYYVGLVYMTLTASPYNIKFAYLTYTPPPNNAPTIGTFQAPSTVYANQYFFLNATINDGDGVADFDYATIEISNNVVLKWTASTNIFSEQSDANGYCTLDASNSQRTTVNSTAYQLSWKIKLTWTYPEGSVNVVATNTKVYDSAGASGSGSQTGLFTFEDDLIVNSASVNDARVNPSQSITFTGQIYYEGTSASPEDASGITAKVELNGVLKGSTTTINSTGHFTITINAETSIANHSYIIYATTDQNTVQNKTVYVVVERLVITISANTTSPAPNAYVNFTVTAVYDYLDTPVTSWTVNIYRNATHYATDNFTDGGYTDLFYVYTVENITENTYGLSSFTSNTVTVYWSTYVALTIKTVDLDSNILTEAVVHFNETSVTVDNNGLATKTGIAKNTNVTVKVEWQGCWVNGSWTVNMTETKTIEASCQVWQLTFNAKDSDGVILASSSTTLAWTSPNGTLNSLERPDGSWTFKVANGTHYYRVGFHGVWITANTTVAMVNKNVTIINCNTNAEAYVLNSVRYHWASNATWTAHSWNSTSLKLEIKFSDSADNYTLIADGPRPTYLLNASFNMPVDYTTILSLAHYGNTTITLSYEAWGDFYIRSTQHRLTSVYWTSQKLTILIEGTTGENGTLTVYCGSRGGPRQATGLANPTYNADTKILSGTYTFSSTVTVTLDWTSVTGGTTGGTSTFGKLDLTIEDIRLTLAKGATETFNLTIHWTGVNDITITEVTITEEYVTWFSLAETLPKQASKGTEAEGTVTIQMKISVPWQITLGQHTIPVTVTASQEGGVTIEKSGVIYLTVTSTAAAATGQIPEVMTYLFLFAVVGLSGYAFIKKKR